MLNESHLTNKYWAEAIRSAVYLLNRSPLKGLNGKTPEEIFTGHKPDVSHLRVFGCICYVHIPAQNRKKLDSKTQKCIFLKYSNFSKGYRCLNPISGKLLISRDVIFDEQANWFTESVTPLHVLAKPKEEPIEASSPTSLEEPQVPSNDQASL
eukprot:c17170_g1_i1 orf=67-525(+)